MTHSTPSAAVAPIGPPSLHNRVATLLTSWIGHDLLALAARAKRAVDKAKVKPPKKRAGARSRNAERVVGKV